VPKVRKGNKRYREGEAGEEVTVKQSMDEKKDCGQREPLPNIFPSHRPCLPLPGSPSVYVLDTSSLWVSL